MKLLLSCSLNMAHGLHHRSPSLRILENKTLCTIASSHQHLKTVVACRVKDGTSHEVARNTGS